MKSLITLVFLLLANQNFAQLRTHTFEQAEKLAKENPKPFFIFIHTSWCQYCKMMENTTFKNDAVVKQLNDNFYFIALDAEDQKPISFNNNDFTFKPKGIRSGVHELAEVLAKKDGVVSYPTVTILNTDYTILVQMQSFINSNDLSNLLSKLKE